jgi:hypothetical protein
MSTQALSIRRKKHPILMVRKNFKNAIDRGEKRFNYPSDISKFRALGQIHSGITRINWDCADSMGLNRLIAITWIQCVRDE